MSECLDHVHYMSRADIGVWVSGKPNGARSWPLPSPDVMVGGACGWSESTVREWITTRRRLTVPATPWLPHCLSET